MAKNWMTYVRAIVLVAIVAFTGLFWLGFPQGERMPAPAAANAVAANVVDRDNVIADHPREYDATQASDTMRISLLGISKGTAFLDSDEIVSTVDRTFGRHVVPWIRVAMLLEPIGDVELAWGSRFELLTPDGTDLVRSRRIMVRQGEKLLPITSRAVGMDGIALDHPGLSHSVWPVGQPKVENPRVARVCNLWMSGHIADVKTVTLKVHFTNPQPQSFVFENIPIP